MVVGKVPNFELINQNNQKISDKSYLGKVFVVEFFFTSCPTICPKMNVNMLEIQKKFFGNPNFGIASISIDPENDTSEVLKSHAAILGATAENWHFLTGNEAYIMDLSYNGFNLYAGKNPKIAGGFEHSGMFALIDKKGNIRCRKDQFDNPIVYYDGLEKAGIKAIIKDITTLLDE
jgi:protein SCO1